MVFAQARHVLLTGQSVPNTGLRHAAGFDLATSWRDSPGTRH